MKEAIGNAFLVNIVIIVCIVIMLLLVSSFSYSKAFKVKNNIINSIEKYECFGSSNPKKNSKCSDVIASIDLDLKQIGYRRNNSYGLCKTMYNSNNKEIRPLYGNVKGNYHYCVYEINEQKGYYYKVITYMHFDVPIIGELVAFPITGTTRIFYNNLEKRI